MAAPARIPIQPWMTTPEASRIFAALGDGSVDIRFVGGCVRDGGLGRSVKDVDIATPEPPPRVIERLEAAGIRVVPTGIDHGTVTAVTDHHPFEITTLRRDVETFGRHARVEFTDDWQADAARRDFTMNAMSCRPSGELFDYHGGWDDLEAGRVRFVGDPVTRIDEDVLRLLRFYRFGAYYGHGVPDAAGRSACRDRAPALACLSGERLRDETLRLLSAPEPEPTVRMMLEDGVLQAFLSEAANPAVLGSLARLETAFGAPSAIRRLAALFDPGVDASAVARRLKLSNADRDRLIDLTRDISGFTPATEPRALRKRLYETGPSRYDDLLLVDAARRDAKADSIASVRETVAGYRKPDLPVGGHDLKALGVEEGARIGQILRAAEQWWIEHDFEPDRPALLDRIASMIDG